MQLLERRVSSNSGQWILLCHPARFVYSQFSEEHIATATVDFTVKLMQRGDIHYRVQLWDIAGQDRFQNISRVILR